MNDITKITLIYLHVYVIGRPGGPHIVLEGRWVRVVRSVGERKREKERGKVRNYEGCG